MTSYKWPASGGGGGGSGTVTEVDTGNGLTGGPITTTGTVALTAPVSVANGGTNSTTALSNNRVVQTSGGKIVEASAITASKALASDSNGIPVASATTATELGYVAGVTSAIQTQLGTKAAGAASSTDKAIARFDSTTGKILQNSVVTVSDAGATTGMTTLGTTGAVTVTVANNTPAFTMFSGAPISFQSFAGAKVEIANAGVLIQFADNSDGNCTILARATKNLYLACDGTNAGKGVIIAGSSGQTAKLLDVQLSDATSIMSVAVNGNTLINTTTGAFSPPRMTETQRDALTPTNGMIVYNTTSDKFQGRAAGAWVDFH